jgi:hypothetical protein
VYCYITIVMIANIIVIAIVFVTAIGIIIASVSLATVTFELTADRSSHLDINRLIHCAFYDSINATTHINHVSILCTQHTTALCINRCTNIDLQPLDCTEWALRCIDP